MICKRYPPLKKLKLFKKGQVFCSISFYNLSKFSSFKLSDGLTYSFIFIDSWGAQVMFQGIMASAVRGDSSSCLTQISGLGQLEIVQFWGYCLSCFSFWRVSQASRSLALLQNSSTFLGPIFSKYFWAWDLIWLKDLFFIYTCIFFQFFPNLQSKDQKQQHQALDHLPTFSFLLRVGLERISEWLSYNLNEVFITSTIIILFLIFNYHQQLSQTLLHLILTRKNKQKKQKQDHHIC